MPDLVRQSKTLSLWLRHKPQAANLSLDAQGWVETDAVLAAFQTAFPGADFDTLLRVVEENDKQRFEFSADLARIRARQGHSVEIDLALPPVTPPPILYHGTVERFLGAIMSGGLKKMRRSHVHLSPDQDTATRVGARRGAPIILRVNAAAMSSAGHVFFVTGNGVWLTDHVPALFLTRL